MHLSNLSSNLNSDQQKVYLTSEQTDKLKHILDRSIPICSSPPSSFPTLNLTPKYFLRRVLSKLKEHSIDVRDICLNGGAASFVLVNDSNFVYRDIDILIHINTPLSSEQKTTLFSSNNEPYSCDVWTIIKYIICSCLLEHIANATSADQQQLPQYTHHYLSTILDTYANKNIKISSELDSWALLSLQNYSGQNLELKFVEYLKRQWQFSVDSFQINIEPLLNDNQINTTTNNNNNNNNNNSTNRHLSHVCKCSSITKTIKTKNLIIDAINGLTIIKKDSDDEQFNDTKYTNDKSNLNSQSLTSTSPLQFGFFTPLASPDIIDQESNIESQTLATITTIATTSKHKSSHESRSHLPKMSISTINEESVNSSLQFYLSLNDDTDDGIVSDADDSANEDDDQIFRTPVDTNSAPPSPATIIAIELPSSQPIIEVYSVYKDLHQALDHLNKKLIATYAPETMRGGGLLKYCDLLAQNYKVHDMTDMLRMQRYMCSRFFIDYKTIHEQIHVITQYITTHFLPLSITNSIQSSSNQSTIQRRISQQNFKNNLQNNESNHITNNIRICLSFFDHLTNVIQSSTVCLTHHDKEATLININQLKQDYQNKYGYIVMGENHHHHQQQQQQQQQRYHSYSNQHHNNHNHYSHHHHHHHNHYHQQYHHHSHCSSSSSNSSRSSSPSSSSSNSYRYYRHNNNNCHTNSHYRNNYNQRQSINSSSYNHGSRNYSNGHYTSHHLSRNQS